MKTTLARTLLGTSLLGGLGALVAFGGFVPSAASVAPAPRGAEPYIGEITMFAGNFPPRGWAFCDGQILPISQNTALFSLVGTTYGGDGRTTFALPDLRGRVPLHAGTGPGLSHRTWGSRGGAERVALSDTQMPSHRHYMNGFPGDATSYNPVGNLPALSVMPSYADPGGRTGRHMAVDAITQEGAGQAHENMQPYLTVHYIIALQGLFPPRN
jgi:microcystin-dependent protein